MEESQTLPSVKGIVPSFSTVILIVLIGIFTLLTVYELWFRSLRFVKLGNQFPGPKALPIVGNGLLALGQTPGNMMRLAVNIYKNVNSEVLRIWIGPKLFIVLMNPADIEIILGSNVHQEKSPEYNLLQPWLGDGLLISKGEKWRTRRKMIAPTFHSSILKSFMSIFNKNANNLLESLKKEEGKVFDVHDYLSGTTVDTLLETAMGVQKTEEDNTGFEYVMAVMRMCNILHLRHYKFWLNPDLIFKFTSMWSEQNYLLDVIHSLTRQVIKRKKELYFLRETRGEQSLYKKAVTTSKLNEEDGSLEETSFSYIKDDLDDNEENDIGEKKRLAFLDYMIEATSGDYTIPSGASVIIGTYILHRNPKIYNNPDKFDPDNFLPESCQSRPYYAYIPFSAGPRSCVGRKYAMLKMKIILASVLRKYRTTSLTKEEDFKLQGDLILKREDGFQIQIVRRS